MGFSLVDFSIKTGKAKEGFEPLDGHVLMRSSKDNIVVIGMARIMEKLKLVNPWVILAGCEADLLFEQVEVGRCHQA